MIRNISGRTSYAKAANSYKTIIGTDPALKKKCGILTSRLKMAVSRSDAFRFLAPAYSEIRGNACVAVEYDLALQTVSVVSFSKSLAGARYLANTPSPLMAELLYNKGPLIIPDLSKLQPQSIEENIRQSGGKHALSPLKIGIIQNFRSRIVPQRHILSLLPKNLNKGAALLIAIPSLFPGIPSQGFIFEHSNKLVFNKDNFKEAQILMWAFALTAHNLAQR